MPLRFEEPPPAVSNLVRSVLEASSGDGKHRLHSLAGRRRDAVRIAHPHPVYNFSLVDLVEGRALANASMTAWRFLLLEDDKTIAAAEIAVDAKNGEPRFSSVTTGPYVAATSKALETQRSDQNLRARDWDVRILRVPGLYLLAMWFHEPTSESDRFLPIGPVPNFLEENRLYRWNELSEKLTHAAKQRITELPLDSHRK